MTLMAHDNNWKHVEFREYAARLRRENRLPTADDLEVEGADGRARNRNVYGSTDRVEQTTRRQLPAAKQPWKERTYDSFCPELNLNCIHALTLEDYAYEIQSYMRCRLDDPPRPEIYIDRLIKLLDLFLLPRNHESPYIRNGQITGGTRIPPLTTRVRNLDSSEPEEKRYFQIANSCGSETPFNFRDYMQSRPARPVYEGRGSVPLKMTVSCTHLGLYTQRKRSLEGIRRRRKYGLAYHLWELEHRNGLNPDDKHVRAYESDFEVVKQYFWGAPKLHKAVQDARMHINTAGNHNRVIKLFQYPQSCESYYKAVNFLGFKKLMLSSDMSAAQRQKNIDDFNNPNNDWEILLIPMSLKVMAHAMHQMCHKVIVIEQAANKATEGNATMRIRRLGQTQPQDVDRSLMRRTYVLMCEESMMQEFDGELRLHYKLPDGAPNGDNIPPTAFGAIVFFFGKLN
ncbi:hypothetical protein KC363_g7324 [Hortaea werneckii]|nr:hypothetical protein KC363_g7324 [Hortaea werneckii]